MIHRLISLAMLLLLSFNAYGSHSLEPTKLLSELSEEQQQLSQQNQFLSQTLATNTDRWAEAARQAGMEDSEPNHLLDMAVMNDLLFGDFLKTQEASFNTVKQWRTHTLATLLMAWSTAKLDTEEALENIIETDTWSTANQVAEDTARYAVSYIGIQGKHWESVWSRTRYAAISAVKNEEAIQNAIQGAIQGITDSTKIAKIAYRVAETQAWIAFSDPDKEVFHKAYKRASLALEQAEIEVSKRCFNLASWRNWLYSEQLLASQIHGFMTTDPRYSGNTRKLLQPLIGHLERIIQMK